MSKEYILYLYPATSTFIKKDIDFLSKHFKIISTDRNWNKKFFTPFHFVHQFFFLLRYIPKSKAVIVMFGGYWSFLPSFLGQIFDKPVLIILGGADCVAFPSINYGHLRKPLLSYFIERSYYFCDLLVPVHKSLIYSDYNYLTDSINSKQGYLHYFPHLKTPCRVIHNGFDALQYHYEPEDKIPNSFIVLASITNNVRFKLKGIDIVIKTALAFPSCHFKIIGISERMQKSIAEIPSNLELISFVEPENLGKHLSESEFILQLSISEGFPNSLCEGMLSGCIPIGSSVGAIPDIIGDCGYIMSTSNFNYIRRRLQHIIQTPQQERKKLAYKSRLRIVDKYSIAKREKKFLDILKRKYFHLS